MTTRIYNGTNRRVVMTGGGSADQIGLTCATPDPDGVDVGGGIDPVSPHCSISYGDDIGL
jgi:hypothetical protein